MIADYAHLRQRMLDQPTVADALNYWLHTRREEIKNNTWRSYAQFKMYIVGPLLIGSREQRKAFAERRVVPPEATFLEVLGGVLVSELTTARIREWHTALSTHVSPYVAKIAKKHLRSALMLAAEDYEHRVPLMPALRGRGTATRKRAILSPEQIGQLLNGARFDELKGIYYSFPFLTGVRPSEQLGLFWEDIDFATSLISIKRVQQIDGTMCEVTKTAAGLRDIPIAPLLRDMLQRWRTICPVRPGLPARVFPSLGSTHLKRRRLNGWALSYVNFLNNYWRPAFARHGLPYVTPHSARHSFISTLQASGTEIGLAAKLAGHADPAVTLSHYTQAVRGGAAAIAALEKMYVGVNASGGTTGGQDEIGAP